MPSLTPGSSGTAVTAAYLSDIGRPVRSVYTTTPITIDRLLHPSIRAGTNGACRSQEPSQVSKSVVVPRPCLVHSRVLSNRSQTALIHVCQQCQAHHAQPMGKRTEKGDENKPIMRYGLASGPPCPQICQQCEGRFSVSYVCVLYTLAFRRTKLMVFRTVDCRSHVVWASTRSNLCWQSPCESSDNYSWNCGKNYRHAHTSSKCASNDLPLRCLPDNCSPIAQELTSPFYFTPARVSSAFHATSPPLLKVASAIVNAGYQVSRSHACAGSIKTNAPTQLIFDIIRKWIELNPVKMSNIKDGSPARVLLAKASQ